MSYIPKVGDSIAAKRKVKTGGFDCVIGPIVDISEEDDLKIVRIDANGRKLYLSSEYWTFEFLFVSAEHSENILRRISLRLMGINKGDATVTERQIADLLVESGYLSIDEDGDYIVWRKHEN
jgi:hypothetical protein